MMLLEENWKASLKTDSKLIITTPLLQSGRRGARKGERENWERSLCSYRAVAPNANLKRWISSNMARMLIRPLLATKISRILPKRLFDWSSKGAKSTKRFSMVLILKGPSRVLQGTRGSLEGLRGPRKSERGPTMVPKDSQGTRRVLKVH